MAFGILQMTKDSWVLNYKSWLQLEILFTALVTCCMPNSNQKKHIRTVAKGKCSTNLKFNLFV